MTLGVLPGAGVDRGGVLALDISFGAEQEGSFDREPAGLDGRLGLPPEAGYFRTKLDRDVAVARYIPREHISEGRPAPPPRHGLKWDVPLIAVLAITLIVILAAIVLTPLALVQRYRLGTARRRARAWVATINAAGLALSAALFLLSAALTSLWIPGALSYSAAGLLAGSLIGIVGLALTRWERFPGSLYYTPNRLLVLAITLVVAARIAFGFWRSWHAWQTTDNYAAWASASGASGSLAAGAVVLGYYLVYWLGVRRRVSG